MPHNGHDMEHHHHDEAVVFTPLVKNFVCKTFELLNSWRHVQSSLTAAGTTRALRSGSGKFPLQRRDQDDDTKRLRSSHFSHVHSHIVSVSTNANTPADGRQWMGHLSLTLRYLSMLLIVPGTDVAIYVETWRPDQTEHALKKELTMSRAPARHRSRNMRATHSARALFTIKGAS